MKMKKSIVVILLLLFFITILFSTKVNAKELHYSNISSVELAVKNNIKNFNQNFNILFTGNDPNIYNKISKMIPKILDSSYEETVYLKSYNYRASYTKQGLLITYKMTYYSTAKKENAADTEIAKQARIIKKANKSKIAQVKAVNDYIVKNTEYSGSNGDSAFTKYGVTHQQKAYCQGYAMVANEFFNILGIQSLIVKGSSRGEAHAWNKVKIDNRWYNIDTTWNDPIKRNKLAVSYKYFLVSDKVLARDHSWKRNDYPTSNSENFDFLRDSSSMEINDGKIYFAYDRDNQKLYSYNINTNRAKKISNTRVQYLSYANNRLYLSNYSQDGRLAVYNLKTGTIKNLNNLYSQFVHTKGNYIYYMVEDGYYRQKM